MLTAVVVVYSGGAFVDALNTPEAKLVEHKDPTEYYHNCSLVVLLCSFL